MFLIPERNDMASKEKDILNELQLFFTSIGSRLFRNNVAKAWMGTIYSRDNNMIMIKNPRLLHSGLAKGSSDLIGWTTKTVTFDMVGKSIAVFTAIEVKTKNIKTTDEQINFINLVNDSGGIGIVAYSVEDVKNKI